MDIFIDNRQNIIEYTDKIEENIKKSIKETIDYFDRGNFFEVSVVLVDNEAIKEINRDYRGKDMETDVLSFPMMEDYWEDDKIKTLLGDMVLSLEKAKEQSEEFGHSIEREISYLTVHSMLHLFGYDHMEEEEKNIMRSMEKEIMKKLETYK